MDSVTPVTRLHALFKDGIEDFSHRMISGDEHNFDEAGSQFLDSEAANSNENSTSVDTFLMNCAAFLTELSSFSKEARAHLDDIERKIETSVHEIKVIERAVDDMERKIKSSKHNIDSFKRAVDDANHNIDTLHCIIDGICREIDNLRLKRDAIMTEHGRRLKLLEEYELIWASLGADSLGSGR